MAGLTDLRRPPKGPHTRCIAISNTDRAYLAALIDGEGTIVMGLGKHGKVQLQMIVTNSHEETIRWCQTATGTGSVFAKKGPVFSWSVPSYGTIEILQAVLPYMRIKRKQADRALQWGTASNEKRLELRKEVMRLNRPYIVDVVLATYDGYLQKVSSNVA